MAHLLDGDLEYRLLPGHVGVAVILGEGDAHLAGLARADSGQLLGEPGQEPGAAEFDLPAFAAAAGDLLLADPADDIGGENIPFSGRALDRHGFALPLGDPLDCLVAILLRHVADHVSQAWPAALEAA